MSATYCPITHESHCKCIYKSELVSPLKVDLKSALRKLFTDHGVYTAFVLKSIVDGTKDTPVYLNRLLDNQKDIGDQLKPIVGELKGNEITKVLKEHIKLAGDVITAAVKKDKTLNNKIKLLFINSDLVAETLTSLNEEALPYSITSDMFHMHNQFVVDQTLARIAGDFKKEQTIYDAYYNELLLMSDAIFHAL